MSREELVNAYVDGGLSRRAFIRRLVAAGVSVGAAASYAHLLAPEAMGADAHVSLDDHYPEVNAVVNSRSLDRVQETGRVRVRVNLAGERARVYVGIERVKRNGEVQFLGERWRDLEPGSHIVRVKLTKKGRRILKGRERARLQAVVIAFDQDASDDGVADFVKVRRRLR